MQIETEELSQGGWKQFKLTNNNGVSLHLLNYGGRITKIMAPNQNGIFENIVLGYKNLEDYKKDPYYLGALIGRVAGRIAGAEFHINNHTYNLEKNDGNNHLHGGSTGFHNTLWDAQPFQDQDQVGLSLSHKRANLEDGYPGDLRVTVTYTLTNNNEIIIDYDAIANEDTFLTLTNHTYFNLSGDLKDTIDQHWLKVNSQKFLELDNELIPTGIMNVLHTPFDFLKWRQLESGLKSKHQQIKLANNGYDHYFIFDRSTNEQLSVKEEKSGRKLTMHTTQPGMILYTANNLNHDVKLSERDSQKYLGICFETQASPGSIMHNDLPSIKLDANTPYKQQTLFRLSAENN
ncbi:aldose epimerase family protein [Alkalibacillus haloalkaliphilus]|uniref:Aldose 1-epimerase n=1 Tax=Alkalibacillus haloalkaliphilus TaxID=94136 RepID=A0A511W4N1_9BACI|nr:aldose epimerase family protein [Alkalibacillus haloalkaliphilus]GEN46066.1 aldose 1-epimerase [Alkalibacillus haloalkaliphilus]